MIPFCFHMTVQHDTTHLLNSLLYFIFLFFFGSYTLGVLTFVYIGFGFGSFWKKGIGVLDMGQYAQRECHDFIRGWVVSFWFVAFGWDV